MTNQSHGCWEDEGAEGELREKRLWGGVGGLDRRVTGMRPIKRDFRKLTHKSVRFKHSSKCPAGK